MSFGYSDGSGGFYGPASPTKAGGGGTGRRGGSKAYKPVTYQPVLLLDELPLGPPMGLGATSPIMACSSPKSYAKSAAPSSGSHLVALATPSSYPQQQYCDTSSLLSATSASFSSATSSPVRRGAAAEGTSYAAMHLHEAGSPGRSVAHSTTGSHASTSASFQAGATLWKKGDVWKPLKGLGVSEDELAEHREKLDRAKREAQAIREANAARLAVASKSHRLQPITITSRDRVRSYNNSLASKLADTRSVGGSEFSGDQGETGSRVSDEGSHLDVAGCREEEGGGAGGWGGPLQSLKGTSGAVTDWQRSAESGPPSGIQSPAALRTLPLPLTPPWSADTSSVTASSMACGAEEGPLRRPPVQDSVVSPGGEVPEEGRKVARNPFSPPAMLRHSEEEREVQPEAGRSPPPSHQVRQQEPDAEPQQVIVSQTCHVSAKMAAYSTLASEKSAAVAAVARMLESLDN